MIGAAVRPRNRRDGHVADGNETVLSPRQNHWMMYVADESARPTRLFSELRTHVTRTSVYEGVLSRT
jgi:hypothetical protein